jgi:hypothetical protein
LVTGIETFQERTSALDACPAALPSVTSIEVRRSIPGRARLAFIGPAEEALPEVAAWLAH